MTLSTSEKNSDREKPDGGKKDSVPRELQDKQFYMTCLAVLGVVYGDIGTQKL